MTSQLHDNTPVFCTAEIPAELLNDFFRAAYSAPDFVNAGGINDIGVLINTINPSTITQPTKLPIPPQPSFPFLGKTPTEIWHFAQAHLKWPIFSGAFAILDEQTLKDKESCLLVTTWECPPPAPPPPHPAAASSSGVDGERIIVGTKKYRDSTEEEVLLTVRSDFKSALVILNVKNQGVGGDGHFELREGRDRGGVLRVYEEEEKGS